MAKPTRTNHEETRVKILLVEDTIEVLEDMISYIRERFSVESCGVRSRERAVRLISEEGYRPDLVIHDCKPVEYEADEVESETVGRELYVFFIDRGLPVAVLSGNSRDEMIHLEEYCSDPPLIWLEKPLKWETLPDGTGRLVQVDQAVEAYFKARQ